MHRARTLFFDLDGTLTDPQEGITKSIQYALTQMGLAAPEADNLLHFIGPPLRESFGELIGAEHAETAVTHYRYRYETEGKGLAENRVYEGIPAMLSALRAQEKKLWVVTSKPHPIARRILTHFDLNGFFEEIYGAEMDGTRNNKGDLIAYILARENFRVDDILMIGDRKHDVLGAARHGIRSIGVTWGYGGAEELTAAGAHRLVGSVSELSGILSGITHKD